MMQESCLTKKEIIKVSDGFCSKLFLFIVLTILL